MKRCPHANIAHCPLYLAAHDAALVHLGCDDGKIEHPFDDCGVARDVDYHRNLGRLMVLDPHMVADRAWREELATRRAQRDCNTRAAGLH